MLDVVPRKCFFQQGRPSFHGHYWRYAPEAEVSPELTISCSLTYLYASQAAPLNGCYNRPVPGPKLSKQVL